MNTLLPFTILAALLFCGCDLQRKITSAEIGCERRDIAFREGDASWYQITGDYWVATCKGKQYACIPTTAVPILQRPNAKCTEIAIPVQ